MLFFCFFCHVQSEYHDNRFLSIDINITVATTCFGMTVNMITIITIIATIYHT